MPKMSQASNLAYIIEISLIKSSNLVVLVKLCYNAIFYMKFVKPKTAPKGGFLKINLVLVLFL